MTFSYDAVMFKGCVAEARAYVQDQYALVCFEHRGNSPLHLLHQDV